MTILWMIDNPVASLIGDAKQAERLVGQVSTQRERARNRARAQAFGEAAQTVDLYLRREENGGKGVPMRSVAELEAAYGKENR